MNEYPGRAKAPAEPEEVRGGRANGEHFGRSPARVRPGYYAHRHADLEDEQRRRRVDPALCQGSDNEQAGVGLKNNCVAAQAVVSMRKPGPKKMPTSAEAAPRQSPPSCTSVFHCSTATPIDVHMATTNTPPEGQLPQRRWPSIEARRIGWLFVSWFPNRRR